MSISRSIEQYILGKDGNRPDLLRRAFTNDATVEMVVNTDAISFPSTLEGLPAIGKVLSSEFNRQYENIYTFCMGEPPAAGSVEHSCKWLVGMSVKDTGEVRVGCGEYHWQFDSHSGRVQHLTICIEHMQVAGAGDLLPVMDWVQGLGYPWCPAQQAVASAPPLESLTAVIDYLKLP